MGYDMFSSNKISSMTFSIKTPDYEPLSRSSAILSWNKYKIKPVFTHLSSFMVKKSIDYRDFKRRILNEFKFFEEVMIESKLRDIVNAIWVGIYLICFRILSSLIIFDWILNVILDGFCKVIIVGKVEWLFICNLLYHLNKLFIFLGSRDNIN